MMAMYKKQIITWRESTNKFVLLVVMDIECVGVPVQGVHLLGLGGYLGTCVALWTCYWSFPTCVFFYNVCYLVLLLPTYISIAEWALYWFLPGFVGEATGIIWAGFCVHYMSVNILVSCVQS